MGSTNENFQDDEQSDTDLEIVNGKKNYVIALLILFLFIAAVFALTTQNNQSVSNDVLVKVQIPEVVFVTSEEMQIERSKLAFKTGDANDLEVPALSIKSDDEVPLDLSFDSDSLTQNRSKQDSLEFESVGYSEPLISVSNNEERVIFGDAFTSYVGDAGSAERVNVEGVVFLIDKSDSSFIFMSNNEKYIVRVDVSTKFFINDKQFSFSSLRETDILVVSGSINASSKIFYAEEVAVIGTLMFDISVN